jgi:hypothetical protein
MATDLIHAAKRSNLLKTPKETLTEKRVKSLLAKTRAEAGQRTTLWDALLPGFGIRITDKHLSYIFAGRFDVEAVRNRLKKL